MERYKFLYELSKKALDDELDRYKKLDEKASRFLSILSVGIVAYTALVNAASPRMLMTGHAGWRTYLFIGLASLTLIALISAWYRIFATIKLSNVPRVEIGAVVNKLAEEEELITMYYRAALACQEAVGKAQRLLEGKLRNLQVAYKEIQFSTGFLVALLLTYFFIIPPISQGDLMTESNKPSQTQTQTGKPADRAQPNKNSTPIPVVESFENYQPPEKK